MNMAYAVIEMGGKQYRVEKGDSVVVDRVAADEGAKLTPRALLYAGDGAQTTVIEGADLDKVKVEAVVTEHLKGEKIRVYKYRPKKRYRKTQGHRSLLTRLEITDLKGPTAAQAAASDKKPTAAKAAAGSTRGRGKDESAKDEEGE